ncbi:MAG: hypothetical protein ACC645_25220, partial [Pirellulales bacterium]
ARAFALFLAVVPAMLWGGAGGGAAPGTHGLPADEAVLENPKGVAKGILRAGGRSAALASPPILSPQRCRLSPIVIDTVWRQRCGEGGI